jgi:hypothetical protein
MLPITDLPKRALQLFATLAAVSGLALSAFAEDDRPTELKFERPGPIPTLDANYRRGDHRVVIIKDADLLPKDVVLEPGQLVAWISYARMGSTIVFEREVAKSMVCHSLVNFSIKEDELRSAEIRPGEFASFCELQPGRYRYKVVRPDAGLSSAPGTTRRLDDWVTVKGEAGS